MSVRSAEINARSQNHVRLSTPTDFRGARVLVVGLGRFGGGVGVTRWLAGQGARVTVTDLADHEALRDSVAEISDLDVPLRLGGHDAADLDAADLVVVNPAVVKHKSPFFQEVLRRGSAWTTEMNLFCERCPAPVVGVTGTFGKSTTSAMLAAALTACVEAGGTPYTAVYLGGNIGRSLLGELNGLRSTDLVVLEMSNAQLEDLPRIAWTPQLAVLTNFSPHHLDRYDGSWEAYARAKLNIAVGATGWQRFVVGPVGEEVERLIQQATGNRQQATGNRQEGPATVGRASLPALGGANEAGTEARSTESRVVRVTPAEPPLRLRVPGMHNLANAHCAWTVCRCLDMPEAAVRQALEEFTGLRHRLQFVRSLDGVDYVNDSKSTSPKATVIAVECYDRPVVAIVGAQDKKVPIEECAAVLARRCRAVVCTGESGPLFAKAIREAGGTAAVHEAATLENAVAFARAASRAGDVVLFSPGGPSFDCYANYEKRGECFMKITEKL